MSERTGERFASRPKRFGNRSAYRLAQDSKFCKARKAQRVAFFFWPGISVCDHEQEYLRSYLSF